MKTGIQSLSSLAALIELQAAAKADFVSPSRNLRMDIVDRAPIMAVEGIAGSAASYNVNDIALGQIGARLEIPSRYMRKMASDNPDLMAYNVNRWLERSPDKRMVRTMGGTMRALLSNSYQRIDNNQVAAALLPVLADFRGIVLRSSQITDERLYMKFTLPSLQREVKGARKGDIVEAGVIITNSEVGMGSVSVSPFALFLVCTNGMTRDGGKKWKHVGRRSSEVDDTVKLADDTRADDDRAQLLVLRDTVKALMSPESFDGWVNKMQGATEQKIEGDIPAAVEVLTDHFALTNAEGSRVLRHLIEGGDLSRYGLMNAVTRTAEDLESYDRASQFEAMGNQVIDLPASAWKRIAYAEAA